MICIGEVCVRGLRDNRDGIDGLGRRSNGNCPFFIAYSYCTVTTSGQNTQRSVPRISSNPSTFDNSPLALASSFPGLCEDALRYPRYRPSRRWKIYVLRFTHDTPPNFEAYRPSCKPRSCRSTGQLRISAVHRY